MFILFFFAEGVMRAWSDTVLLSRVCAGIEIALCTLFFASAVYYARFARMAGIPVR